MFRLRYQQEKANKEFKVNNSLQKAIENCQIELAKDPTNAALHVRLGDLYIEWHLDIHQARQYIDEAITEYQRALESYINSAEIYFKIGNVTLVAVHTPIHESPHTRQVMIDRGGG